MKTYVKNDGELTFDGLPCVALPVEDLIKMGAQEATGKGILIANYRETFRLSDLNTGHTNEPVEFVVSLRIERNALSQAETDLIARTAARKDAAQATKNAKEATGRKEVYAAISSTAVQTAKALTDANKDPIAEAIRANVTNTLSAAFGSKALTSGNHPATE